MAVSAETKAYILELFEGVGDVTARAMMGGLAIYSRGQIFALYAGSDEGLFLKASGSFAEALKAEGAHQFTYTGKKGKPARMGYWSLPETALDDPEEACEWARRALRAVDPDFS
ncbi:TfoX/Sxy family protein [Amaricoccus macauensis]|uniref:TfoX/Sxy family protein n=1 Tax=Amaricoccus macauensis TaxID=57001 RepID=UPI003C7E0E45